MNPVTCEHLEFEINALVARIAKTEGGPIVAYDATVTVKCTGCGTPFRWLGLQAGMSAAGPMSSVDGLELRAPIAPQGCETDIALPGFTVQQRGVH